MKQWKIKKADSLLINEFSKNLGISSILSRVLVNRDVTSLSAAHNFLHGDLSHLHDWRQLGDIEKAAARIKKAVSQKEKILIYGDYDVDGITACVLLRDFLLKIGADVVYYIPDRIEEGYGLNKSVFPFAKEENVSLIVTVDCGISAVEEVEFLNAQNIDVIITDHHKPRGEKIPRAQAVVCPQRPDCFYPFKELSGVGVAFKLAQAIAGEVPGNLFEYLDLVALGTVADVVPLLDENRILVKEGLRKISETNRRGLKALVEMSGLAGKNITAKHVGFILGPRLNASGRLSSAEAAVKLLLTDDENEAREIAGELHKSNRERQRLQEQILNQALSKVENEINFTEHKVIVLEDEGWHPGLIGIVASRVAQEFYRPTIIISSHQTPAKGSGRSIKNFHLFEAISECHHLLEGFGGHKGACGISILKENIEAFSEHINELARKVLKKEDLMPAVEVDAEFPLAEVDINLIEELNLLAPFGTGNPQPTFLSRQIFFKSKPRAFGKKHFKGWVTDGRNICEAVGFGMADTLSPLGKEKFDAVYYPALNEWGGIETISLYLDDARPAGG